MLRLDGERTDASDGSFASLMDRASEALAGGDLDAARGALERAVTLRPKDAQALGLLGQACYRQGRFDDAADAWKRLVDDNPVEPGARVNLGLALLKGKRHAEARRQLEIAVDLDPEHRRAMNYLGLALLESGSPVDAREWFRKAGSEQMVARCDEAMAGGWQGPGLPAAGVASGASVTAAVSVAAAAPAGPSLGSEPGGLEALAPVEAPSAVPASSLRAWAASRRVRAPEGAPFEVREGVLAVAVRGVLRARLDGLFAIRGRVALVGELKRFHGRATDRAFGEGASRMHRASGEGELFLHAGGRRFTAVALGDEAAFLREEAVFAFEDGLAFENGRVPSSTHAGLNLVHLRGRGNLLLCTAGEPVALEVAPGAPLRVPLRAVVGWAGALTPRVVPLAEAADQPATAVVELAGEGWALADPAGAEARA